MLAYALRLQTQEAGGLTAPFGYGYPDPPPVVQEPQRAQLPAGSSFYPDHAASAQSHTAPPLAADADDELPEQSSLIQSYFNASGEQEPSSSHQQQHQQQQQATEPNEDSMTMSAEVALQQLQQRFAGVRPVTADMKGGLLTAFIIYLIAHCHSLRLSR